MRPDGEVLKSGPLLMLCERRAEIQVFVQGRERSILRVFNAFDFYPRVCYIEIGSGASTLLSWPHK